MRTYECTIPLRATLTVSFDGDDELDTEEAIRQASSVLNYAGVVIEVEAGVPYDGGVEISGAGPQFDLKNATLDKSGEVWDEGE